MRTRDFIQVFGAAILLCAVLLFILGFVFGMSFGHGWGLPLGTSLTLFIACLGLFVTLYNSYLSRRHYQLSVKPHLIFDSTFDSVTKDNHYTYTLKLKNVGLGPAVIQSYRIALDKNDNLNAHSVFEELVKMANKNISGKGRPHCVATYLDEGQAIDKGSDQILVRIGWPKEGKSFMEARELAKHLVKLIDATVVYKSHYGNKDIVSKRYNEEPNKLSQQDAASGAAA